MEADRPEFESWHWPLQAEEAWGNRSASLSLSVLFSVTRTLTAAPLNTWEEWAVT